MKTPKREYEDKKEVVIGTVKKGKKRIVLVEYQEYTDEDLAEEKKAEKLNEKIRKNKGRT